MSSPALCLRAHGPLSCALSGKSLLTSSYFNKGSAFPLDERDAFNLHGLLPAAVHTLDQQIERAYGQYLGQPNNMAKNTFLTSLKEQNCVLFYGLVTSHLKEMLPVVYTPTEGEAIEQYSEIFRRPEGCFLDVHHPERVRDSLAEWGSKDEIDYVVVTDGEEILGIGDQGVGGVLISAAKLVLMTLCGGLHPNRTLPVVLDCGTDNDKLLQDNLYLGLRHRRVRGEQYDEFVDTFVRAVASLFPNAVLHFEDFGLNNARKLLDKYRPQLACFNDDVQGTGVAALAAVQTAAWVSKTECADLRMLVFGAGSAGTGIADHFRDMLVQNGKSREEATAQVWLVDKQGLVLRSQGSQLTAAQSPYARSDGDFCDVDATSLVDIVRAVKPHVLIGCSTKAGAFTEAVIREMARHVDRPIVFPLSNPTRLHEATPEDICAWTNGRALVATGSPFPQVNGTDIAECNNAVAFPGIGLGAVLCRARMISDGMLAAAVKALAETAPVLKDPQKGLLPDLVDVRGVSRKIACAVIRQAVDEGLSTKAVPAQGGELEAWVEHQMFRPVYRPLRKVEHSIATRAEKGELGVGRR